MSRWAHQPHEHKGLVPAFLLVFNRITHASIRTPVRMPSKSLRLKRAGINHATPAAHNTLLNHTPMGDSSDKN